MASTDSESADAYYARIIAVDITCCVVSTICIALRFYIRCKLVKHVQLDDWLMLAAVICFMVNCLCDAAGWMSEFGNDPTTNGAMINMLSTIDVMPYALSEGLVRLAYATLYLRLIPKELDHPWARGLIIVSATLYAAYEAVMGVVYMFQCGVPKLYTPLGTTCLNATAMANIYIVTYYADIALDWMMAIIPMVIVWRSTMQLRMKVTVTLVLLLGCVAGLLALAIIIVSIANDGWSFYNGPMQVSGITLDILAQLETQIAILGLTLIALRPLVRGKLGSDPSPTLNISLPEVSFEDEIQLNVDDMTITRVTSGGTEDKMGATRSLKVLTVTTTEAPSTDEEAGLRDIR